MRRQTAQGTWRRRGEVLLRLPVVAVLFLATLSTWTPGLHPHADGDDGRRCAVCRTANNRSLDLPAPAPRIVAAPWADPSPLPCDAPPPLASNAQSAPTTRGPPSSSQSSTV